ncbi:MAG: hypothetical protein Q9216_003822 [Gyalolechia sp. 2 TL-2023]
MAEKSSEHASRVNHGNFDGQDAGFQRAISRLFSALINHEASLDLMSKIGSTNVASELSTLFTFVQSGNLNYRSCRDLSRLVIGQASDVVIWNAVFELITAVLQPTHPTSIPPSYNDTPVKISSASQQASEQTRRLVENRIFDEIKDCTFKDVEGFIPKYFEGKPWSNNSYRFYQSIKDQHVAGRWAAFPEPPVQDDVFQWWFDLLAPLRATERGFYYTSETRELTGGEAKRQLDLFVKPNTEELQKDKYNWKDVQVIGELKQSEDDKKANLLQVGRYVRDVFSAQPTRRHVHVFTLYGSTMQAWVFDRSGPYSSTAFNIHEKPELFILIATGYLMMSDEELGLDTFIQRDNGNHYVNITDGFGKERLLQFNPEPIAHQRAIVCRGTSCFHAKLPNAGDYHCVVKFSWVSATRRPEAELLALANERGVEGIAKLIGHHHITTIAAMRKDLTFGKRHAFRGTLSTSGSSSSTSRFLFNSPYSQRLKASTTGTPSGQQKPSDAVTDSRKRPRSDSRKPDEADNGNSRENETSLYARDNSPFDNRVFSCLVIQPGGRPLREFVSILELLEAFRDAIKAHRSLFTRGRILHRDISENNIIITNPEQNGGFTGMLIDQDLAKELGSARSGARHQTGTMEFMAIQVLNRIDHTYRHDLESFLYVFLWICARRVWERGFQCKKTNRHPTDALTSWYTGSFSMIADSKQGHMHVDLFERILDRFPGSLNRLKPLCRRLREILFSPLEHGALFLGTPESPEILYDPMIEAFDTTSQQLRPVVIDPSGFYT